MDTRRKIAVAGATGRVGHHIVDVLSSEGHDVVPMARALGVDVITGAGLAEALVGVDAIIDVATGPSPEEDAATEFFTTAARNLQDAGSRAGVERMVVVSIIGIDKLSHGYNVAKLAHEDAAFAGPVPATVLRAAQFHEFVAQLMEWGSQGDVSYVPEMRTQLVAARTVARALADLAVAPDFEPGSIGEIAGPARGEPGRGGEAARRPPRRDAPDRGRHRPVRSRRRDDGVGRAAPRTRRRSRRPHVRGMAELGRVRRPARPHDLTT